MKRSTAQIVRCGDANRRARISQREHSGKRAKRRKLVASPFKSAKLAVAGNYGGAKMSSRFTQYILIAMALGIVMGTHRLQYHARQPGGDRGRRKPDRDAVPAPDQDDHRAAGVRHAGRRHRAYGLRLQARPRLRQDHGLVRQRLLRLAAARPGDGQSAAARRQLSRHAARQGAVDRPAGLGVLDREVPDPSDPDLDRGCDGAERDPADRGVRGVLRASRSARCRSAPSRSWR